MSLNSTIQLWSTSRYDPIRLVNAVELQSVAGAPHRHVYGGRWQGRRRQAIGCAACLVVGPATGARLGGISRAGWLAFDFVGGGFWRDDRLRRGPSKPTATRLCLVKFSAFRTGAGLSGGSRAGWPMLGIVWSVGGSRFGPV